MKVTPVEHGLDLTLSDLVRSPGLHASDIYGELFQDLEPERYKRDSPMNSVLTALGTAWEKHLEYLLLKNGIRAERPEEFMSPEGIAYSPDLLIFNGVTRLGEIKLTSMSADSMPRTPTNSLPPKFDKFLVQMRLYAYWLNVRFGWLAVLFLYKPYAPEFRVFELEFGERELQDNYQMCVNYAESKGMMFNGKAVKR